MNREKNEEFFIKRFTRDLENLSNLDVEKVARAADDEYRDILQLARNLREVDFSKGRKAKEELKKKLISTLVKIKKQQLELPQEELDLEELEYVAGGLKKDPDCPFQDN